jgi:hypothetical protein
MPSLWRDEQIIKHDVSLRAVDIDRDERDIGIVGCDMNEIRCEIRGGSDDMDKIEGEICLDVIPHVQRYYYDNCVGY